MERIRRFPREESKHHGLRTKDISRIVEKLSKKWKKDRREKGISTLGDSVFSLPRGYISSGVLPIDCIVCYGYGFPTGIVEIFGPEASGKSAVLQQILAEAQRNDYVTGIFEMEYSLDYRRTRTVGLDKDRLVIFDAETIEDVYEELKDFVREVRKKSRDVPIVLGWDSIAATPTQTELDMSKAGGLEKSDMGKFALQMSKLFRRLLRFLFVNKVCLLCINQTRVNLQQRWGNKEVTYGGKALKFYAWVRCRIRTIKQIKEGDDVVGIMCEMRVVKNKIAPPFKSCKIPIYWGRGIDIPRTVWEYLLDRGLLEKKGMAFKLNGVLVTRTLFPKYYANHKSRIDKMIRREAMRG